MFVVWDVTPCASSPCPYFSTCLVRQFSPHNRTYECLCHANYTGRNCESGTCEHTCTQSLNLKLEISRAPGKFWKRLWSWKTLKKFLKSNVVVLEFATVHTFSSTDQWSLFSEMSCRAVGIKQLYTLFCIQFHHLPFSTTWFLFNLITTYVLHLWSLLLAHLPAPLWKSPIAPLGMLHLGYEMNSPLISVSLVRHSLLHFHLSHMAVHHLHHLHYHRLHLLLLAQYFILNSRLGSSANPILHRPFPFLPDWLHGLLDHLMILLCSTAAFVCMVY